MKKYIVATMLLLTACNDEALNSFNNIMDDSHQMRYCALGSTPQSRAAHGCEDTRATQDYNDCMKLHDKYICEPFREKAGIARYQ